MVNQARKLLIRTNAEQTVGSAAIVISMAYLLSRLLGLFRDRLLIATFGKGAILDSYNAAFRLPELLFTLLVSGAFAVSFIPIFTEYLQKDKREEAWRIASSLMTLLVIATVVGGAVMAVFADQLTTLITPGFDPARHQMTVELTRIMLLTPIFFSVSSVLGSIQQSFNRFTIFALSGVMYNLGIIAGIVLLTKHYGVYGVAYGVVLGVVLQAILQWAGMYGLGFKFKPELGLNLKGTRRTLKLMVPRSLDQGIDQINYLFETIIASTLAQGSIVAFTLANNLKNVPLVLISSSIATAMFPRLAARAAKGARQDLIEGYAKTARLILFLAIPAAVFAVVTRGYLVRLLYGFGDVDTANTLGWFAGTIIFAGLFQLVSRVYFAMQDTRTPLYVSLASIPINIILSFILSRFYGVPGLAMAASFVATLETVTLLIILHRREGDFGEKQIIQGFLPMTVAGAVMTGLTYLTIRVIVPLYAADKGFFTLAPKFMVVLLIGSLAYLIPCYVLRIKEAKIFVSRVRDIMVRSVDLT
jgi:putative peptidoglycan lipid II flippase